MTTTPSPALAPYVPTYASRAPYLTVAEFKASPTGVDTSQIVPGGTEDANLAALKRQIARASSWIDSHCDQVLAATVDTASGRYRVRHDGQIWVACPNTPVVMVTAAKWGWTAETMTTLTDLSGVRVTRKLAKIPLHAASAAGRSVEADVTYVNGWANTTLSADTIDGATSLPVNDPTGIVPGLPMRLDDGTNPVTVTVADNYEIGSDTVPLTDPLADTYTAGASLSALPEAIKQAAVVVTTALIKARGAQAVVLDDVQPKMSPKKTTTSQASKGKYPEAEDLLAPFVRVI